MKTEIKLKLAEVVPIIPQKESNEGKDGATHLSISLKILEMSIDYMMKTILILYPHY